MNPTEQILQKFEQISAIPRGSGQEGAIRTWLQAWASARGFVSKADAAGNLVIQVPARPGFEQTHAIILQGHMDMVCEKMPESQHDFACDPIRLIRDGEWIQADQTTLGADNGIAIAMMLALAEAEGVGHPALELLLTVSEEVGLVGASELDPSLVSAKTLINLDSETVGAFTVGCAGGGTVNLTLPVTWMFSRDDEAAFELRIDGLLGGHSGEDINHHRANANKVLARVLDSVQRRVAIRLAALKGGTVRNAIPRAAQAVFVCAKEQAALCREVYAASAAEILAEQVRLEPGLSITLTERSGGPLPTIRPAESVNAIRLLVALPHGVAAMSAEMAGFVETSNNIGVMELTQAGLEIISSQRSSVFSALVEIIERVEALAWLAGAQTERTKIFPPWRPNLASPLLKQCISVYQTLAHETPRIVMTHGGLECGIISDRCGGLDAISLGPRLENLHSPDERLFVPSLAPIWEFLLALLASRAD